MADNTGGGGPMTNRAPDTLQPAYNWRTDAVCGRPRYAKNRDLWFPHPTDNEARQAAKGICDSCPVRAQCATWALANRIENGVWGGLDERTRRTLQRRYTWRLNDPNFLATVVAKAVAPAGRPTFRAVYEERITPADNGHVKWTVTTTSINIDGRLYTPMQIAFIVGHDREPEGVVRAACGITGCVALDHLNDRAMRKQRAGGRAVAA